jgi:hypothetical protein
MIKQVIPVASLEITEEIKLPAVEVAPKGEPAAFEPVKPMEVPQFERGPAASNSDLFEKTANFGSDVTNVAQYYKNNPELFNRVTVTSAPDAAAWDHQSDKMHREHLKERSSILYGYNFEDNFTKL